MESSSLRPRTIYCKIRKVEVAETQEELVRQKLLCLMINDLGYPEECFGIEKSLSGMPHLEISKAKIPKRRSDIIFFGKNIHPKFPLYPLLLIECKAVKLTSATLNQVIGYNTHLKALAIAIANQQEIRTGWYSSEKQGYSFVSGMPSLAELKGLLSRQFPLPP